MDNSHAALVSVKLDAVGFRKYRCDRLMSLGVNLGSLTKVLKYAKDDDIATIKAGDDADVLNLTYEAKSKFLFCFCFVCFYGRRPFVVHGKVLDLLVLGLVICKSTFALLTRRY
jgi:hypothetical protein